MKRLCCLLLTVWALAACVSVPAVHHDEGLLNADRLFQDKKYSDAAEAYDKIVKESPASERGARALYSLALVHANYDNPQKDYAQALQDFDDFLRLYPANEKALEAQNWKFILKTVLDLKKENGRLLQSINELKQIDIRHEERRKGR